MSKSIVTLIFPQTTLLFPHPISPSSLLLGPTNRPINLLPTIPHNFPSRVHRIDILILKLIESIEIGLQTLRAIAIAVAHIRERIIVEDLAAAVHVDLAAFGGFLDWFGLVGSSFHFCNYGLWIIWDSNQ